MKITGLDFAAVAAVGSQVGLSAAILLFGATGRLPVHFNWTGEADGWADRNQIALMVAVLALLTALVYGFLPILARRKMQAEVAVAGFSRPAIAPARSLAITLVSLISVMLGVIGFGYLHAKGGGSFQMAFLAMLSVVIGVWVGKTEPNPFVGVRTYWALRSRLAWDKSNRLFGRIALWSGIVGLVASFNAPQPLGLQLMLLALVGATLLAVFESWRVWRTDSDRLTV